MKMKILLAAFLIVSLGGCSTVSTSEEILDFTNDQTVSLLIRVDKEVFQLDSNGITEIEAFYRNDSEGSLYLRGCSQILEKLQNDEWILAYSVACVGLTPEVGKVGMGQEWSAIIRINKAVFDNPRDASWNPVIETIEGKYRIRSTVFPSWDEEQFMSDPGAYPKKYFYSNTFDIKI